jgi:PAS domain S-box-containing protein
LPGERGLPPRLTALRWLAAAAIGLPTAIMAAIGIVSWHAVWRDAEQELSRSADAVSEYVLRVFDGHRVASDRVNDLLENLTNEQIQQSERELHQKLARLLPSLPLVETIAVSRPDGLLLLTANIYPVPSNTFIPDREWIRDLRKLDAPATHVSKVSVGRLDANLFFGVSRRRLMADRKTASEVYDGVINVAIEPNRVAAGFADLISGPGDVVSIIRADGEILARLPGFGGPLPPLRPETNPSFFRHVAAKTSRAVYVTKSQSSAADWLVVHRPIQGFPVSAAVARDRATIRTRWWWSFSQHLGLGIPAIVLVGAMTIFAARRAEERDRAQAAARFHAVFDANPIGMAVVNVENEVIIASNEVLAKLTGMSAEHLETSGVRLRTLLAPEFIDNYVAAFDLAKQVGSSGPLEVDLRGLEHRVPVRISMSSLPGDPPRIVLVIQDITEVRETEARRDLIMREVEHRAKNTLAVVQAALRLGASGATDAQALARAVEARVAALARSQSVFTSAGEQGAWIQELIEQEVAPFAPTNKTAAQKLVIEGPKIRVTAAGAQALTMTFHELATNAAKYGALSASEGSVHIAWRVESDRQVLTLEWREHSVITLREQPSRVGFGTRLIDTAIEHQLEGRVERQWAATGLSVKVQIPLKHVKETSAK